MRRDSNDMYVVAATPAARLPKSATVLGAKDDIAWGAVPLQELNQLLAGGTEGLTLLYLSQAEYRAAISGLDEAQILEVVRQHIDRSSTYLWDTVDNLGKDLGRRGAEADARSQSATDPQNAKAWGDVASLSLAAHQTCHMTGRFIDCNAQELSRVIQWRATLLTLEKELSARTGDSKELHKATHAAITAYDDTFGELAEVARELGEPAYTEAPAGDLQPRLVFVPRDHPIITAKAARGEVSAVEWNGGLLVSLTPDDIDQIFILKKPTMLYFSSAEYSWARTRLTPAQLERDLRMRYKAGGPTAAQILDDIISLRLAVIAHLGALMSEAQRQARLSERSMALLSSSQLRELRLLPGLLQGASGHGRETDVANLRESFNRARSRLSVVRYSCKARGETDLVDCINRMVERVDKTVDTLSRITP